MSLFGGFFDGIAASSRTELDAVRVRRSFDLGRDLKHAGDHSGALLQIVRGRVKAWRPGRNGSALTLRYMREGDVPGLVEIIQDGTSLATFTAMTPVVVNSWPGAVVRRLLGQDAVLANNGLRLVTNLASLFADRLDDAVNAPAEQQMSRALLRMAAERADWRDIEEVTLAVSRQELADLTGVTLYTASRMLSDWDRRGLLASGRGRVVIKQPKALERMADLVA